MKAARLSLVVLSMTGLLSACASMRVASVPLCPGADRNTATLLLMAQAVPSAAYVPCIAEFPAGWTFGGERIRDRRPEFWMDSDRAGMHAVSVVLTRECDTSNAIEVPQEAGEPLMRRYEEPTVLPPTLSGSRYYVFPGGCVTYRFSFLDGATYAQVVEASEALTFVPRELGVTELAKEGIVLCGRGVPCPG